MFVVVVGGGVCVCVCTRASFSIVIMELYPPPHPTHVKMTINHSRLYTIGLKIILFFIFMYI